MLAAVLIDDLQRIKLIPVVHKELMANLQERAIKAAEMFVERRGMEVLNAEWKSEDGGAIDLVALENEAVVFIDVNAHSGADKGMPEENIPAARERMEVNAAKWLAENADDERFVNVSIRFDIISRLVLSGDRALLGHHINCLGSDFTDRKSVV